MKFTISSRRLWGRLLVALAGGFVCANLFVFFWAARYTLAVRKLTRGAGDTVFHDARGRPWFRLDERRRDVPLAKIAPVLRNAVIAVEDHRFYKHGSLDAIAILRAGSENVRAGGIVQGGSTITQQLARMLFLSNERTWTRKLKEAALAFLIERQLTKDQILELYLNRVYFSGGVYGCESISRKLFGKPASAVNLAEAAMIAGLIRAPSALSPWQNPEGALKRSRVVLARMRELGFIRPEDERAALGSPPAIRPWTVANESSASWAQEFLRQQFRDRFGDDHPPDWQVHTTFVPELQDIAARAVARGLARLRNRRVQAALVAADPNTGDLLALIGGRSFGESRFNRATRARRQPGSAFKPFLFAAALERGYSPVSVLSGLNKIDAGFEEWVPANAHGELPDELTLREALLESNNRAAAALGRQITTAPLLRVANDLGMRNLPNVPSLSLGTGEVTPFELTMAYAVFANGGWAVTPRSIVKVLDAGGSKVLENEVRRKRVLSRESAFQMVSMLRDVLDRGTGAQARALGVRFDAGGKTGTTDNFKDAWFVGFSTSIVAGVWVGLDQPAPIGPNAYGASVALPIWADFMREAARLRPPGRFEPPASLRQETLCRISYLAPLDGCPTYTEFFKDGDAVPTRLCPIHSGSIPQRAARAFRSVFSRLKGLFGK
ncbi:MAG TPA: PBP1A family penicillin-binding protein [Bryobacteraceae bacterium]|nr:PBP1A family penicillin-binding protein [Bryobacteraceae bacterium]HOQ46466.1 PBP1A family penicillin-binding protein [Bryobacteraceae bacterium]HPU72625.1 PBP1A family penicillin-binding protein [Bryobacteraceae bacterium]